MVLNLMMIPSSSSSFMASMWQLLTISMIFMSIPSLLKAANDEPQLPTSTISAAPALLPALSPLASPPLPAGTGPAASSPDITPLFPSPGGPSPSESTFPTIPSSPSPPNPDAIGAAPGPGMAFSPVGPLQMESSPSSSNPVFQVSSFLSSAIVSALFVVLYW
ncbi:OLC1v1007522C1 [Oldenlandia corymbosa var. corymbosa]|uniref:OLC1v1007522C1 n=1 Tax=Oldenlandia corymbosa var. corymbosa TaxID=529605 RepID=A0AAV1DJH1_OLDCO|nr:OLC1v1007522C1 [Oldenlandia corymbosa var. corymbosa]